MSKFILIILSLLLSVSCSRSNKQRTHNFSIIDCESFSSDSTLQFCGFFSFIKEIQPDLAETSFFPKIYLSFHLPMEYVQNSNTGEIALSKNDSILKYLVYEHGPIPYFCSDIIVVNAEAPAILIPIDGEIQYYYQSATCQSLKVVFNKFTFENNRYLPNKYVYSDTIYYSNNL